MSFSSGTPAGTERAGSDDDRTLWSVSGRTVRTGPEGKRCDRRALVVTCAGSASRYHQAGPFPIICGAWARPD